MSNVLFNAAVRLHESDSLPRVMDELWDSLSQYEKIYSYVLYREKEGGYKVNYMIAQNNQLNCVDVKNAISNILTAIVNDNGEKKIIFYEQPDLDVLIDVLQPLVHKLAKEQFDHWKCFEYEDLLQMCNLTICDLYQKGYYIHKRIVRKAFMNYVLMQLRPRRCEPEFISIYQTFNGDEELEKLSIADTIVDESDKLDEEETYRIAVNKAIFDEVKQIVIELIGPRQFDQLFRDYGMKHTTSQTRRMMQKVKNHFASIGISIKEFNDKYYG